MASHPRPGRPAGPAEGTRATVLTAALELLLSEGLPALTTVRLHERTGMARSTIHRHWPTPDDVVDDLLEQAERTEQPEPTGHLVPDLQAALEALAWRLAHRPVAPFLAALMAGPPDDPRGLERRARYLAALTRGISVSVSAARPALPRSRRDEVVRLVAGPVLLDWLATGRPPTPARSRAVIARAVGPGT